MRGPASPAEMEMALDAIRKILNQCSDGEYSMNAALEDIIEIAEECLDES